MSDARVLEPDLELAKLLRPGKTNSYPVHERSGKFCFELRIADRWGRAVFADTEDEAWEKWYTGYEERTNFPCFDIDLNAMSEVWKVLEERGLWPVVLSAFEGIRGFHPRFSDESLRRFLNDLPGQVKSAIKVLGETQGQT